MIAAKFDDGGRHDGIRFTGIEDQGKAIAELAKNFLAAGAGGRAGNVGAGASERDSEFLDELMHDFASGPAEGNTTGVGGNLEGQARGGVEDHGERAGPQGLGEAIEIVGQLAGENVGVV